MESYIVYSIILIGFFVGVSLFITNKKNLKFLKIKKFRNDTEDGDGRWEVSEKFKYYKENVLKNLLFNNYIREKKEREIYEAMAFIKNFTVSTGGDVGCEFILERLSDRKSIMRDSYINALSLIRLNKLEEAEKEISNACDTESGKSFASLIINWDKIQPNNLMEILDTRSKSIREIYFTKAKRREELLSDIIYFPVVMNVFVVFINFIYVGYFMQQKEMLDMIF